MKLEIQKEGPSWPHGAREYQTARCLPSGRPWPKISIVTVTLNQGIYIEETILSVLNQGYPNLEYIVIDGGSKDNTLDILDRYRSMLSVCISERDDGQANAINKGFALSTGDIMAWLNSDDLYSPGALFRVANAFDTFKTDMIAGGCELFEGSYRNPVHSHHCRMPLEKELHLSFKDLVAIDQCWLKGHFFCQPEVFWTREIWECCGGLNEALYYAMDYDLWVKMAMADAVIVHLPDLLAHLRLHENQKTNLETRNFEPELRRLSRLYAKQLEIDPQLQ